MSITRTSDKPAGEAMRRRKFRKKSWIIALICAVLLVGAAVPAALTLWSSPNAAARRPVRYLGLYARTSPASYAGMQQFSASTGVQPNLVMYYSSWQEPFQTTFANTAASHGAVPLVQMNPSGVSLAKIAAGQYDGYLTAYAKAVRAYHRPVIVSFGHEMNGYWYSWAYTQTSPKVFVAAWRHLVTVFRAVGVPNVTWMWTVNIMNQAGGIASPSAWWPGRSYVNWVGIDGYYSTPSLTFASLFGPTITTVRELTSDPILVAETAATPGAGQPAKIADLFAGIQLYDLLGFVWFNVQQYSLQGPAAITAFRRGAHAYRTAGHGA